jgi:hypothetical protein
MGNFWLGIHMGLAGIDVTGVYDGQEGWLYLHHRRLFPVKVERPSRVW